MDNLKFYSQAFPNHQNALDLFEGEWSSKLPDDELQAGEVPLFKDNRINWAEKVLGGFNGKTILELGPLEGGHSYMLEQLGAASVLGIEANGRAYLKCLITKEVLNLNACKFLLGDSLQFMEEGNQVFDVCLASGILYHMAQPIKMLSLFSKVAPILILWTHYYEPECLKAIPVMYRRFRKPVKKHFDGKKYELFPFKYGRTLRVKGYRAGMQSYSHWMKKEDIFFALKKYGYPHILIGDDSLKHPSGPSLLLIASRNPLPISG